MAPRPEGARPWFPDLWASSPSLAPWPPASPCLSPALGISPQITCSTVCSTLPSSACAARGQFSEARTTVKWSSLQPQHGHRARHPSLSSVQFSSVAQSCPTLCDPMNSSTPGLPVHHPLPEFTQTRVHRVGDAIQPSHPLSSPFPPALNPSQHESFPMSHLFA